MGDYFYEYGQEEHYPLASEAVRWHGLAPPTEAGAGVTADPLQEYRMRHALHRTDPDLQLLSETAPLIAVWDDHEISNDPWVGGAQDHNEGEGDWWARKRAAVKAYHEWMPTRTAAPPSCAGDCTDSHEGELVYRSFAFGDLAALPASWWKCPPPCQRTAPPRLLSSFSGPSGRSYATRSAT